MTLAFEPTEAGTMRRPPRRPDEPILTGLLAWRVLLVSILRQPAPCSPCSCWPCGAA